MVHSLDTLGTSVQRLRAVVGPLDDETIARPAHPTEWTIAEVMSHIGSGAVILRRRIDDEVAGVDTPDDFAPTTWDEWNAKSARAQVDDGLAADRAALDRLLAVSDDQRRELSFAMGPMTFDFDTFVELRVNEHAFHTWDIEVALDPAATIPVVIAAVVVDNLELIARYTARPVGDPGTVTVRTTEPERTFAIEYSPEAVELRPTSDDIGAADVELPAEAFARLVYGRLDPDHTPPFVGEAAVVDRLRTTFPGA